MLEHIAKFKYYLILLLAHLLLVWFLPYFPTQDGPSHVYNLAILYDLINGGKEWGDFYTYQIRAVPNLGFNLFSYPLLYLFSPITAERIFLSFYIILMAAVVPLLLKTFERDIFPLSYYVFPVIFNHSLMMGFYSYTIAVAFFLLALSLIWKKRDASLFVRFFLFNIAGLVIFYLHLIPFFFFLLSLTAISIASSRGLRQAIYNLIKLGLIISPLILNLIYYFLNTAKDYPHKSFPIAFIPWYYLLTDFLLFSTVNFFWQLLPASLFSFVFVFLGYIKIKDICKRWHSKEISISERFLIYLTAGMFLVYLFAPVRFGEGGYFNIRLPWVILLISLPLLIIPENDFLRRFKTIITLFIVTIFFIFNVFVLLQQSRIVERFLSGLHLNIPKGSFVMAYKKNRPELSRVDVLGHAASYYGLFKGCVNVGNYEAFRVSLFPVKFRKDLPLMPNPDQIFYAPETIIFSDYPFIQHVIGWEVDEDNRKRLGKHYQVIWQKGEVSIWKRMEGF